MLRRVDGRPDIAEAIESLPLGPLRRALAGVEAYLVGGLVRDLLRGADPGPDIDIAIDGDLGPLLESLDLMAGIEVVARHERFATASVLVGGASVDLTRTRFESYAFPGALPDVSPAPIGRDLERRDFTVNAIAVELGTPDHLVDPFDGATDLRQGVLRVLHPASLRDDPTRAVRAARYASRLDLDPEPQTLELLRAADLSTVSAERLDVELRRLAVEPAAARGFELLVEWGLLDPAPGTIGLIGAVEEHAALPPWSEDPTARADAILIAVAGGERAEVTMRLVRAQPERPSEAVRLAAGHEPGELLLAAAAGAEWIDPYLSDWHPMQLEINGGDLIAEGIPPGPAIGLGLRGALERKLDGGLPGGREEELEVALAIARAAI